MTSPAEQRRSGERRKTRLPSLEGWEFRVSHSGSECSVRLAPGKHVGSRGCCQWRRGSSPRCGAVPAAERRGRRAAAGRDRVPLHGLLSQRKKEGKAAVRTPPARICSPPWVLCLLAVLLRTRRRLLLRGCIASTWQIPHLHLICRPWTPDTPTPRRRSCQTGSF